MILEQLSYSVNFEKYGIDPKELEGKELEDQVQVVLDKMQQYIDNKTAEKVAYDKQRTEFLQKAAALKVKRNKAKGKADSCRTQLISFKKNYKDNKDLINYKKNK